MNRASRWIETLLLAALAGAVGACGTPALPVAQMRGLHLRRVEPDFQTRSVKIELDVRFRLNNTLSVPIPIPDHTAQFRLAGVDMGTVSAQLPSGGTVPASGFANLDYRVHIDTGLLPQSVLGRDVPYRFSASLGFGSLGIPMDDVVLWIEDALRIPLLPQAQLIDAPSLKLLGGEVNRVPREIDLNFLAGLRDGLAELVYLAAPGDASEKEDARNSWLEMFDAMVDVSPEVELVRTTPVTGMELEIPVKIHNPNLFEIALPSLAVDFDAGGKNVWTVKQSPSSGSLGATGSRSVTYTSTFHFDGLDELALPTSAPELAIDASVDLGHGATELPIRIP